MKADQIWVNKLNCKEEEIVTLKVKIEQLYLEKEEATQVQNEKFRETIEILKSDHQAEIVILNAQFQEELHQAIINSASENETY